METSLFQLSPMAVAAIPVVIAMVQGIKQFGVPTKWLPLIAIGVGLGAVALTGVAWQAIIIQGLLIGLAAMGTYSGYKATIK